MGLLARAIGAILVVLAILPASSSAAPRADVKAFAAAASTAAAEIRATAPQTRIDVAAADLSRCVSALQRLTAVSISAEARGRFAILTQIALHNASYARALPTLERFVSQIDRIRTADPALRSARAGWRQYTGYLAVLLAVPITPPVFCVELESWVGAGAPGLPFPELDLRAAAAVLANGGGGRQEARIARGATRLARLGAPRQRARRFSMQGMLSEHLRISQSIVESYSPPGTQR
jgi:hypothetical protein